MGGGLMVGRDPHFGDTLWCCARKKNDNKAFQGGFPFGQPGTVGKTGEMPSSDAQKFLLQEN